jgi:predicted nucleic acid-binding Zn ribbon protein
VASRFKENLCPPSPGLEIKIVKFQLTSHECKGSELKKWINLCNIYYAGKGLYRVLVAET